MDLSWWNFSQNILFETLSTTDTFRERKISVEDVVVLENVRCGSDIALLCVRTSALSQEYLENLYVSCHGYRCMVIITGSCRLYATGDSRSRPRLPLRPNRVLYRSPIRNNTNDS